MQDLAVRFSGVEQVEMVSRPAGEPGAGEVRVALAYSAISPGTELATLRGKAMPLPLNPGYSASGVVEAVGPGVEDLAPGQRVAVRAPHAARAVVPAAQCHALPDTLSLREAAMYRLASIAIQGVRKVDVALGDRVAVVGLGIIGQLAGDLAWIAGAGQVVGADPQAWRGELALAGHFAKHAPGPETLASEGFDVVIESTGVPGVVPAALELACTRGRAVLLGSPRGVTAEVDFYRLVHRKGLTLIGAHDAVRSERDNVGPWRTEAYDGRTVVGLMADGRLNVSRFASDEMPGGEAVSAYRRLLAGDERLMTILLRWEEG
ncbi:MAG: zinc-binding alcohol dehydrogenase [Phycisphaeraceae bacterium]